MTKSLLWETITKTWQGKIVTLLFFLLTIWWITLQFPITKSDLSGRLFGAGYGVVALWGALNGLFISNKWGGFKSIFGRALLMFSLGLFAQEFGQISYFYYVFIQHIEVPYPSIGDIGYFGSIPFYIYGIFLLGKASGVKIVLRSFTKKILALVIPLAMLILGYALFLNNYKFDWLNPLKIYLDFGYPLGEAIYVSIAIVTYLLSRNFLGGVMRDKIFFILFALGVQFLSDYTFLYQVSRNTWAPNGINDYMYLLAYFFMTLGLLQLGNTFYKLKNSS